MMRVRAMACAWVLVVATGCGSGTGVPVSGTVRLDDQPLADIVVTFIPDAQTKGPQGTARTGPDGKYELVNAQGKKEMTPGTYRVTIARMHAAPAVEGGPAVGDVGVKNQLPRVFSDPQATTLTATVEAGKTNDFDLKTPKK